MINDTEEMDTKIGNLSEGFPERSARHTISTSHKWHWPEWKRTAFEEIVRVWLTEDCVADLLVGIVLTAVPWNACWPPAQEQQIPSVCLH